MTTVEHDPIEVLNKVAATAAILKCSAKTVRELLEQGDLQRVDLNRHAVRVTGASIREFIARGGSS